MGQGVESSPYPPQTTVRAGRPVLVARSIRALGITAGPDGALWFTEGNLSTLGRITDSGDIDHYQVSSAFSEPIAITLGPDDQLWFTEANLDKIGQVVFVSARLTVAPTQGPSRAPVVFAGSEFDPWEAVQIYLRGVGSDVLASAMRDMRGCFTVDGRVPESADGSRIFLAQGQKSKKLAAARFLVAQCS